MSEHDITFNAERWKSYCEACRSASTDKVILIPGIEYSDPNNTVHILIWGIDSFLGHSRPIGELLQEAKRLNGVSVFAHPSRRNAWRDFDPAWVSLLVGVELWNRKFDGVAPSPHAIEILNQHIRLTSFVGLDLHKANQLFPLSIKLTYQGLLSEATIMEALRCCSEKCTGSAFGISDTRYRTGILAWLTRLAERNRRKLRKKHYARYE